MAANALPVAERELRFAVVLYGGVSLAIYMHGATKELHRLVRASARLAGDAGAGTAPEGAGAAARVQGEASAEAVGGLNAVADPVDNPTETVWRELLAAKAREEDVRTRVVIDLIAGTSAGGINGVYLAKALAHDLSQEALRDLWFERGDIGVLLRGLRPLPWKTRIPYVLATLPWKPALRGDDMAVWLHDALLAMTPVSDDPNASLLPPGHPLRLFVTATDHSGYPRGLMLGDPPVVVDHRHRHVMEFRYGDGADDFGSDPLDDVALAFAARATSCFPGAFEPVSIREFSGWLHRKRDVAIDVSELERRRIFRAYPLAGATAGAAHFVDGGVLDNRPFGHIIGAIPEVPAGVEVDRRLLYLEPSPSRARPGEQEHGPGPNPITTVLASVAGIPRNEPILDEILAIGRRNERVMALQDVIRTSWSQIADCVTATVGFEELADPPADPNDPQLRSWHERLHEQAMAQTGFGYTSYTRVKIADAVEAWAATLCRLSSYPSDCDQASLVRTALRSWARRAGLFQEQAELTDAQLSFLRDFDLGYGERRLRFVIAAVNWWYDPGTEAEFPVPTRAQLDAAKVRLYRALDELQTTMRGADLPEDLGRRIDQTFGEMALADYVALGPDGATRLLDDRAPELGAIAAEFRAHLQQRLTGFSGRVYADLHALTREWHPEARRRLMIRYLGFPIWDAVLYPLQSVANLGERDSIEIVRLSPQDANELKPPSGRKLVGTRLGNFGAFFTRSGRENDYLWGRLDTAERLVGILLGRDHPDRRRWTHRIFAAILDEEEPDLRQAADVIAALREQLDLEAVGV